MSEGDLVDIRCRGCRRLLGVGPADFRIYCDAWCAADFPAFAQEARDALIEAVYQEYSPSQAGLARQFEISRQRVDQILTQRNLKAA